MHTVQKIALIATLMVVVLPTANAQLVVGDDMLDNCARIDGLRNDEKYGEARAAARLCLEGLDQILEGEVEDHFLKDVAGWKRKSFEQNNAMGFKITTARYRKDSHTVTVTLTGGASGGSGLGALSGLVNLGMMQTGRKVKVGGLPGSIEANGDLKVTMDDGSFLIFACPDFKDADAALAGMGDLVNAFPVAEINKTLIEGA